MFWCRIREPTTKLHTARDCEVTAEGPNNGLREVQNFLRLVAFCWVAPTEVSRPTPIPLSSRLQKCVQNVTLKFGTNCSVYCKLLYYLSVQNKFILAICTRTTRVQLTTIWHYMVVFIVSYCITFQYNTSLYQP
jgi:hypothetical protein